MDGPPTYSQLHALRPLHALPPHLLADGDDDEEGEEVRRAELRDAVKGYAAFVGALAGSLDGPWARAVVTLHATERPETLGERGGWSLVHAQVRVMSMITNIDGWRDGWTRVANADHGSMRPPTELCGRAAGPARGLGAAVAPALRHGAGRAGGVVGVDVARCGGGPGGSEGVDRAP